jgi:hypothetical protein
MQGFFFQVNSIRNTKKLFDKELNSLNLRSLQMNLFLNNCHGQYSFK